MADVEVSEQMAAPAGTVYALVSDVTRMGDWSPETTGCRWLDGADGPAVGARFRGTNRHGPRRWSTTCTVTDADPGRRFAFEVDFRGVPVARWEYAFEPSGRGCTVSESWTDLRPGWLRVGSMPLMGVLDRPAHNRRNMLATLGALRRAAEQLPS
jgi:hypothetical protein